MKDRMITFTIVTMIIGFMVAIQFQITKEPEVRDTRNVNELRQALTVEKERQKELNEEIDRQIELLNELEQSENVEDVISDVIEELSESAGLTEKSGAGVVIEISPHFDENYSGGAIRSVPPHLLRMLINELNINGAEEIAIGHQRIVSNSAIREANGVTLVNGSRMTQFPLKVRVITDDPEQLHHAIMSSQSKEYFSYDNFNIESQPINYLTIPAYERTYRVRYMTPVKEDS
ncbi:DUF881 domain-containing protein [Evansella halocellulosilytica]|uniref:DUF881 domain-containing protein n=1 Tax=Evansella halocellulosilytica TaxID=2011013 RepID=UPI0015CADA74|nr:DUF881 domain-containing protein [Evansella halocellulosilytica]